MTDELVSFETAKLAKEKGFDIPCLNYYFKNKVLKANTLKGTNGYYGEEYDFSFEEMLEDWNNGWLTNKEGGRCFGCNESQYYLETYSAPTQSLLQRWLREENNIVIAIDYYSAVGNEQWYYIVRVYHPKTLSGSHEFVKSRFIEYEEALELGFTGST